MLPMKSMRNTHMDEARSDSRIECRSCDCAIEYCQFCDKEDCEKAVCYGCMIIALRAQIPDLHPHGG